MICVLIQPYISWCCLPYRDSYTSELVGASGVQLFPPRCDKLGDKLGDWLGVKDGYLESMQSLGGHLLSLFEVPQKLN